MSFTWSVTLLAWTAHSIPSSNNPTKYASAAVWRAISASMVYRNAFSRGQNLCVTSRTTRAKGNFGTRKSVDVWYFRISWSALVPGLWRRRRGGAAAALDDVASDGAARCLRCGGTFLVRGILDESEWICVSVRINRWCLLAKRQ